MSCLFSYLVLPVLAVLQPHVAGYNTSTQGKIPKTYIAVDFGKSTDTSKRIQLILPEKEREQYYEDRLREQEANEKMLWMEEIAQDSRRQTSLRETYAVGAIPVEQDVSNIPDTHSDVREGVKMERKDVDSGTLGVTTQNSLNVASRNAESSVGEIHTLRIKATAEQWNKIKGYIAYCGAVYREV